MPRKVTREEFDKAVEAIWSEIEYRNDLDRRTDEDEAKDIEGFRTTRWSNAGNSVFGLDEEACGGCGYFYGL